MTQKLQCVNRFESLSTDVDSDEPIDIMSVDVGAVGGRVQEVQGLKRERKLRIATWNFSGLCKQKEVYRVRARRL